MASPMCCFCFSIEKNDRKKRAIDSNRDAEWETNDEMLSDLSTFSVREQERRLKMALKEEERISKEAEKVVKWVKQESTRMDASAIGKIVGEHDDDDAPAIKSVKRT
ncbi:hypothetical protein SLA2020_466750 [Shorea laevis]